MSDETQITITLTLTQKQIDNIDNISTALCENDPPHWATDEASGWLEEILSKAKEAK